MKDCGSRAEGEHRQRIILNTSDFSWSNTFRIVIRGTERADLKLFPATPLQTLTHRGLKTTEETWSRASDMQNFVWFCCGENESVCAPVCRTLRRSHSDLHNSTGRQTTLWGCIRNSLRDLVWCVRECVFNMVKRYILTRLMSRQGTQREAWRALKDL